MNYRKLTYILTLLFLAQGCGLAIRSVPVKLEGSGAWGLIQDEKGSPVAGGRIYAYEIITYDEEPYEKDLDIEDLIKAEGLSDNDRKAHYDRFRGPADYISALSNAEGQYILRLPPGTYCLVARKRAEGVPDVGPLTPEDLSSLISQPIEVKDKQAINLNLTIRKLVNEGFFSSKYTIRASNTHIMGKIADEAGQPLQGLLVIANKRPKISRKPDYVSFPSEKDGSFTLYLPSGGIYYLKLKENILGEYLPCYIESDYVNPVDYSLEIFTGNSVNGITIIRLKEEQGE